MVSRIPRLAARRRDAHKGDFGRVLVIGGSREMIGAPALAAHAALRSGAGLATVACPRSIQLTVASLCPWATTIPLPEGPDGLIVPHLAIEALRAQGLLDAAGTPSVAAIGPGLGRSDRRFDAQVVGLARAFAAANVPVVLDADALHSLRIAGDDGRAGWDHSRHGRAILTPHAGEMARLAGVSRAAVEQDRTGIAVRMAREMSGGPGGTAVDTRCVIVLKGSGTIVTDGVSMYVNKSGNAGMATGGSGDVLTGVIAALVAQRMSDLDAAVLGVYVHGLAGDLAAKKVGQVSLIAQDLIEHLPEAFKRVSRR